MGNTKSQGGVEEVPLEGHVARRHENRPPDSMIRSDNKMRADKRKWHYANRHNEKEVTAGLITRPVTALASDLFLHYLTIYSWSDLSD